MNRSHRIPALIRPVLLGGLLLALGGLSCRRAPGPAAIRIGSAEWRVELALTDPQRIRGLGGRKSIPEGTGMLFVFPRSAPRAFHMKDCHVPIDVAFISADLTVVECHAMVVEPDPQNPQISYPSLNDAQYALEVAGGALARAGVERGDRVTLLGAARDAAKEAR